MSIQKVGENDKQLVSWLNRDVVKNAFALYDLQYEGEFTEIYIALDEEGLIESYLLLYKRLKYPSVIIEGKIGKTRPLLEKIDFQKMIIHIPPEHLPIIKDVFPNARLFHEDWMLIKRNQLLSTGKIRARKMRIEEAPKLANLNPGLHRDSSEYEEVIEKFAVYGIFINDKLVSTARSFIQLPEIWFIGGVYTHPKHRNKGYATQATYAVTKEGLDNSGQASLFVRSDNYPALRAYTKIGYKKIGNKIWVDIGTGIEP